MESNFIKERVVTKEEIIKKNLESEKKIKGKKTAPFTSKSVDRIPSDHVIALEEVVNEKLKPQLVKISKKVDETCQLIADYLKVKSALKIFKSNPKDVRVQTNIGCNFYAQCHIADASKIFLCIGKDYFLEMGLDEAIKMIEFKEKQWLKHLDVLQERACMIKAQIKIDLEYLDRFYELDREKLTRLD